MAASRVHLVDHYKKVTGILDPMVNGPVAQIVDQVAGFKSGRNQKKYTSVSMQTTCPTFLTNQGTINFIIPGDSGQISRVWINFNIQITNAPVRLLPAFMWFYKISSFQDSTNARGMETNWVNLLMSYDNLLPEQFRVMAQSMLVDPDDAWTTNFTPVGTYQVYVPLFDNCLFTNALLKAYPKNMNMSIISPINGCIEQGLATNVSLISAQLILEESLVPEEKAYSLLNSYRIPNERVFLDWQILTPQIITNAQTVVPINITLTGAEGVCPFLIYGLQLYTDLTPAYGACKRFAKLASAVSQAKVALCDPSGVPYTAQSIDPYLQIQFAAESSYNNLLSGAWQNLYFMDFTKNRIASMNGIMGAGWRKAINNEILQIIPGPYIAEVPRVVTLTTVDATGAAVSAAGGSFQLHYCDGLGYTYTSAQINWNDSQATVQTVIDNMDVYGSALITVGTTNVNAAAGLTITMTRLNEYDTTVQGARWGVLTNSLRTASAALFPKIVDVGGSVSAGLVPNTQYQAYILFPKFSNLIIFPDRTTRIKPIDAPPALQGDVL